MLPLVVTAAPSQARRRVLRRRIQLLVAATIAYNVVEAVIALVAGSVASSSALVAFGLDSIVEVLSAAAVAWQVAVADHERRERVALRLIACSFFGLAAFVSVDALRNLATGAVAQHSTVGIALACVSVVLMPLLSYAERRAGRELGSRSAVADSKQTLLCTYLSAVLLIGLVTNSAFGWWWAASLAALVSASVAVKGGVDAWRGDACCAPLPVTSEAAPCTEDCCR